MNISALPELLLSWVKNQGAALLQAGEKTPLATFQTGQQYDGKVIENLTNGRHLVRIGNQMLDMNLPAKTQPGDSVRLTYLNAGSNGSVRPTFLLSQSAVNPVQQVQISNTAQQVNTLLRLAQTPVVAASTAAQVVAAAPVASAAVKAVQAPPTLGRASVTETLKASPLPASTAASAGITSAKGIAPSSIPSAVSTTAPSTVSTAAPSTAPLAAAVRPIAANVMMLQNYSAAVLPTTATLTGPNTGLLGQAVDAPRAAVSASTTLSANTLLELPATSRHMLPMRLSQTLSESGLFYESHLARWSNGTFSLENLQREPLARLGGEIPVSSRLAELGGMPEEAARMAGRQLQMLEGAPFTWQGLVWPGQSMTWLIQDEAAGGGSDGSDEASGEWATELDLTFPHMGEVHAKLSLSGANLRLQLQAGNSVTRDTMAAALPQLAKGFEASGLHPREMRIEAISTSTPYG